jgi:uncharacterized protein (UPF0276 family)
MTNSHRNPSDSPIPTPPADAPPLGVGVGLRTVHYPDVLERGRAGDLGVDWFELLSENYMVSGGRPLRIVSEVREWAPIALHGVSMNIGSTDPLETDYLDALARLERLARPRWISDHLCWTGVEGRNLHDLLPLPYTDEAARHVAARVRRVQDRLGRRIALENVSSYMSYVPDGMSEWEFLLAIAEEADCGILFDVNNVFVSAHNHGFDPNRYIDAIPAGRVFQIHLAGHSISGDMLIDTHDHPVPEGVWQLYERAIARLGPISTLIEWDDDIPTYDRLIEEAGRARSVVERLWPHRSERPFDEASTRSSGSDSGGAIDVAS